MSSSRIRAFLSHSDKDKKIATDLKEKLAKYEIDVFLAHVDLDGGTEWESKLFSEIQGCNIFLILITKNYHGSNYTDQETGIALGLPKPLLPICIDETRPYGFMSRYQAEICSSDLTQENINKIVKSCGKLTKSGPSITDMLIKRLQNAASYSEAHSLAKMLEEQEELSNEQINELAVAYLGNNEVNQSYMASPIILQILQRNSGMLDGELYDEIFE